MFDRFTAEARTVVIHAQQHARRLGHCQIGCEHLLLALAAGDSPAAAVLREQGITPERVEDEIVRLVGLGGGAALFADLDPGALAAIGIDLDAVRLAIEASFGADALTRADRTLHREPRRSRLNPRQAVPPSLARGWRRWRRARRPHGRTANVVTTDDRLLSATGRYHAPPPLPTGHLRFTARAKNSLERSMIEARGRHDTHIGAEHLALAVLGTQGGPLPVIVSKLGASPATLRAAITNRYRQAS
jgi:Clp amino terminal domain, pathogenicity island component